MTYISQSTRLQGTMFIYSEVNPSCIVSYNFSSAKFIGEPNVTAENGGIFAEELFPHGSLWKNKSTLHTLSKCMPHVLVGNVVFKFYVVALNHLHLRKIWFKVQLIRHARGRLT